MKKIYTERYSYSNIEPGTTQYDDFTLFEEITVPARYIHAIVPSDQGNRFIEALPPPRNDEQIKADYSKGILTYNHKKESSEPPETRISLVGQLRELRLPLPFDFELDRRFHEALVSSYRSRYQMVDSEIPTAVMIEDQSESVYRRVCSKSGGTNAGFTLLGQSGCGKSSALQLLLSRYPQVIIHNDDKGRRQPQIVYLLVNCTTNSNFNALYASIGEAIDRALGLSTNTYQELISKRKSLGDKAAKVRELIEIFAIGIIILDEIQLIDFRSTKENSFEALMTLSNTTQVAFGIVGTEDAHAQMFTKLRTARRVGAPISASRYCGDKDYFSFLVRQLFSYQWFDEYTAPTTSMVNALYDETHGIIDQLIGLYTFMNIDYINTKHKEKPVINADFIHKTSSKYYRGLRELTTANISEYEREQRSKEIIESAQAKAAEIVDESRQYKAAYELMHQSTQKLADIQILKKNILANIKKVCDYSDSKIIDAIDKTLRIPENIDKGETELTKAVLKKLFSHSKTKTKKEPHTKPSHEEMRSYLLDENLSPKKTA